MARDPESIQREIDQARDALAQSIDVLGDRVSPKHLVATGKESVQSTLADPRVRYGLIALGVLVVAALLRSIFR